MNTLLNPPAPPKPEGRTVTIPLGHDGYAIQINTSPLHPDGQLIRLTTGSPAILSRLTASELETLSYNLSNETGNTR